mmetsp:Transcript_7158/g.10262  ORF Transcript_7158/g.10262 Transcript_7158/m.10262 type:complete len:155 (-) Transcript_7158:1037-1501(-)
MMKFQRSRKKTSIIHRTLHDKLILLILCVSLPFRVHGVFSRKKTILTWVNGIGHTMDHMNKGIISISSMFGGKQVMFCHNPTAMTRENDYVGYIGDLTQAGTQKLGRITAEVDALVRSVFVHFKSTIPSVSSIIIKDVSLYRCYQNKIKFVSGH